MLETLKELVGKDAAYELAGNITRETLIDSYDIMCSLEEDKSKEGKALWRTIKYFSTPDQWKEFKRAF